MDNSVDDDDDFRTAGAAGGINRTVLPKNPEELCAFVVIVGIPFMDLVAKQHGCNDDDDDDDAVVIIMAAIAICINLLTLAFIFWWLLWKSPGWRESLLL